MTEFIVEDVFRITGRGPVITRSRLASKEALQAGELFTTGQTIHCGELEAIVAGIERFPGFSQDAQLQGALLLRGVELEQLEVGQVWVG